MRELRTGDVLAGYRIDGLIGRGGMGVVYRATHLRLDRVDAVKVIAPELTEQAEFRSRFERECRVAAAIDHPNVIPIYAAGEEEGVLYIAMRFVDGTDVRTVLRREGALEPVRAAQIAAAVGAALDAAHERGLVHRDVKPANVLLADRRHVECVYLTDFGLAKVTASPEGETKTGMFVGTTDYVSPEQVLGARLDARSDVYSLGCTLFHMLTGQVPYPLAADAAKLVAHTRDPVPSVIDVAPGVPAAFDAVIARATAKRPEDRFASAGDLGRAARAAAEGQIVPHGHGSVARGQAAPAVQTVVAETPEGERPEATVLATPPPRGRRETVNRPSEASGALAATAAPPPRSAPAPPPSSGDAAAGEPESPGATRRNRRWAMWGAAGVLAAAAVVAVVVALTGGSGRPKGPRAGQFTNGAVTVGNSPDGIVISRGKTWVANAGDGTVTRLDEVTAKVLGTTRYANHPLTGAPVVATGNTIWLGDDVDGNVIRVDAGTGNVVGSPVHVGGHPTAMTVAAGDIWVANSGNNTVSRIDAGTGRVVGSPIAVGPDPTRMGLGGGSVWVANEGNGTVTRLDASTGQALGTLTVGDSPNAITLLNGVVWVANPDNNTVARFAASSGARIGPPIHVGVDPRRMAASQTNIWVANAGNGTVTKINASNGRVIDTVKVGGHPDSITIDGGIVWVASWSASTVEFKGTPGTVTRIDEDRGKIVPAAGAS